MIIHLGVGGAYPSSGLKEGDIAIAEKEIYGDEGVFLKDGFHTAETIGIPFLVKARKRYFNEFLHDKKLFKMAVRISRVTFHASHITVESGPFLTLSTCTGTVRGRRNLRKHSMLFAKIWKVLRWRMYVLSCGIPMVEIRGISNIVGERKDKMEYKSGCGELPEGGAELLKNYNF